MSLLSIYSGSACAWIISEINRDTMGELQVVIPKAASTLLYPMVRPLTVRLGSLLLRIYSAFSFVLFSALYFLKTANNQELNVLLFAEYGKILLQAHSAWTRMGYFTAISMTSSVIQRYK